MKRFVVVVLVLMLLLCSGCSQATDFNPVYNLSNTSGGIMAETAEGIYWLNSADQLLYYADKTDLTNWVPVCARPDCEHTASTARQESECHADMFDYQMFDIQDGKIHCYSFNGTAQRELDGSNHEQLREWQFPLGRASVRRCYFGGKVLYGASYNPEEDKTIWDNYVVVLDPESQEQDVVLYYEQSQGAEGIEFAQKSTDNVYNVYYEKRTGEMGEESLGYYAYDPEANTLVEADESCQYELGRIGDKIYSFIEGEGFKCGDTVVVPVERTEFYTGLFHNYLYTAGWMNQADLDRLTIYDENGNVVASMPEEMNRADWFWKLYGYTDDLVFWEVTDYSTRPEYWSRKYYAMDVAALAEGRMELTLCYTFEVR